MYKINNFNMTIIMTFNSANVLKIKKVLFILNVTDEYCT